MKDLMSWTAKNRGLTYSFFALALAVLFVAAASGCQLEDLVKFDTPQDVQTAIGVDPSVPVSQADIVWDDWQAYVERNTERLQAEIEGGRDRAAVLLSFVNTGMQAASGPISTLPGGAFMVGGASLLTGLFLKRPGDRRREEEAISKAVKEATEACEDCPDAGCEDCPK